MAIILVITGNRQTASEMEAELMSQSDDIEVRLVCSIAEYDDELDDVDVLITDGTTLRAKQKPGWESYRWFSWPEYSATKCRSVPIPVIHMPRINGVNLPSDDVAKTARQAIDALPRRW